MRMRIDVLTLFPGMFNPYIEESILGRAQGAGHLSLHLHNIRDYATDKHHITDEPPYGGGGGMVLKPGPIFAAVEAVLGQEAGGTVGRGRFPLRRPTPSPATAESGHADTSGPPIILLTPQGRRFTQEVARELAGHEWLVLICGRYEGVDERVREHLVTDEISIGDFVLTGGELAAMVMIDAVTRLLPGVLGAEDAAETDSFAGGLLEGPHYTRPEEFRGWRVPEVLRSGHAANIARWRRQQALRWTWLRRPELLLTAELTEEDRYFLAELAEETAGR